MDAILRSAAIYVFLLILFRVAGRRALSEMTNFDFVLLLIIGEATRQGLLGDDFSVVNAFLVIAALVTFDVGLSLVKEWWPKFARVVDGVPMVIVEDGKPLRERMRRARIDEADVMRFARETQGIERMDQIRFAVLEISGSISVIPK